MSSPSLQSLLIQTRIDDRHRAISLPAAALGQPGGHDATSDHGQTRRERRSTVRFLRHYAEMVVVMFAGMFILYAPAGVLLGALGTSWSRLSPAMYTFVMAVTMTAPMVTWMRYRGHAWQANLEMAASMLIPTFAVMGALWAGLAKGGLMVPEHAAMLTFMLIAMLLRRDEYSGVAHHPGDRRAAIAA